jgi:hypothetical protein
MYHQILASNHEQATYLSNRSLQMKSFFKRTSHVAFATSPSSSSFVSSPCDFRHDGVHKPFFGPTHPQSTPCALGNGNKSFLFPSLCSALRFPKLQLQNYIACVAVWTQNRTRDCSCLVLRSQSCMTQKTCLESPSWFELMGSPGSPRLAVSVYAQKWRYGLEKNSSKTYV